MLAALGRHRLAHVPEALLQCSCGRQIKAGRLGLHVVVHGAATAGAPAAAAAQRPGSLGTIDRRAFIVISAGDRKGLLQGGGLERGAADPELHHGENNGDRGIDPQIQHD